MMMLIHYHWRVHRLCRSGRGTKPTRRTRRATRRRTRGAGDHGGGEEGVEVVAYEPPERRLSLPAVDLAVSNALRAPGERKLFWAASQVCRRCGGLAVR
jgi:hypothetical protein